MKKVTHWMYPYLFLCLPIISLSAQNSENLKKKKNFISNLMKKMTLDEKIGQLYQCSGGGDITGPNKERIIIRKSKFPPNPERSVQFSGKRTKRSVQKKGCTQHL